MAESSISVREFICFLPYELPDDTPVPYTPNFPHDPLNCGPPFEPTDTLVLTSPRGTFVDLRLNKPELNEPALPNQGGPMERLNAAFAGKSTSQPVEREDEDTVTMRHAAWDHWVDSAYPVGAPNIPIDEGDMYPLPDGREVEVGLMESPFTGDICTYEEMWKEVAVKVCGDEGMKWCVVMRVDDVARQTRGVVIRLGQYCQGILKVREHTTVERWEYMADDEAEEHLGMGEWTRTVRLGDLFLPCLVAVKSWDLWQGTRATYGDMTWTVEEVISW
jgi:hypothetical protein